MSAPDNFNYEHCRFLIERFDSSYDAINNKGSFYIGLNTFILGGICAGYITLEKRIDPTCIFWIQFSLLFAWCILSIFFTIKAISPFLRDNENKEHTPALIFFWGIARFNQNTFIDKFEKQTQESILTDMRIQVHCLASGLKRKYANLRRASLCLILEFSFLVLFFVYLIINLKP